MGTTKREREYGKRITDEERAAIQQASLERATTGQAMTNYPAIIEGFAEKGIAFEDIRPRENVFTFHAWRALGRCVKRGESGVKVVTWVQTKGAADAETGEESPGRRVAKTAVVFHVSQTFELATK